MSIISTRTRQDVPRRRQRRRLVVKNVKWEEAVEIRARIGRGSVIVPRDA